MAWMGSKLISHLDKKDTTVRSVTVRCFIMLCTCLGLYEVHELLPIACSDVNEHFLPGNGMKDSRPTSLAMIFNLHSVR